MKSETIIPDEKTLRRSKKQRIKKAGLEHLHIISDFDKKQSQVYVDGRTIPSIISLLKRNDYISVRILLKQKKF
jgi:CRISPR/Cas system-associated exonuclease Cas4 (RecB family)